jgi:hypothetical protein
MKHAIAIFFALAAGLTSPSALAEEQPSGAKLIRVSGPIDSYQQRRFSLKPGSDHISVELVDYFYSSGPLSQPWVTIEGNGRITLHIGTPRKSGLFQTKDEYARSAVIRIERGYAPKGATLYILNEDSGEPLGQAKIP